MSEHGRKVGLVPRPVLWIVAEKERQLSIRLKARVAPDDRPCAGRESIAGGQIEPYLCLSRRGLDRHAKGPCTGFRYVDGDLTRRAFGIATPDRMHIAAHFNDLPQGVLPRADFGGQRGHVLFLCLPPVGANGIKRVGRRLVSEGLPENAKVFRVQFLRAGDVLDRSLAGREFSAMPNGSGQIRRIRQFALRVRIRREELAEFRRAVIGPVAAVFACVELNAVREENRVVRDLLGGVKILCQQGGRDFGKGFGRVAEPLSGRALCGKFARRLEINAGQVSDRVVVFGIA